MPTRHPNNLTAISGLPHHEQPATRRDFLARAGGGFGALAMSYLLSGTTLAAPGAAAPSPLSPLAAKPPHYRPRAKSVIFLFMEGGPSHIDLFDPKPKLNDLAGKQLPDSFGPVITAMGESRSPLLACKRS